METLNKVDGDQNRSNDLLSCPFCGGDAAYNTVKYPVNGSIHRLNGQNEFYGVNCISCMANTLGLVGSGTKAEAAERWNTRTR